MKKVVLLTALLPFSVLADYSQPTSETNKQKPLPEVYFYLNTGIVELNKDMPSDFAITDETAKPNFGLGFGYNVNQYLAVEAFYRYSETEYEIDTVNSQLPIDNFSIQTHQFGGAIVPSTHVFGSSGLEVFGKLGASFAQINTVDTINDGKYAKESGALFEAGLGVQWNSENDVLVRLEYTNIFADSGFEHAMKNTTFDGVQLSIGYSFY